MIDRSTGEESFADWSRHGRHAISPDGKEVWAASRIDAKISIYFDGYGRDCGGILKRRQGTQADGLHAGRTRWVWVTNSASNQTTVFDAHARELLATLAMSKAPSGVYFSGDGRRAYVTNANANELIFVDVATRQILSTIPIKNDPDGVRGPRDNFDFSGAGFSLRGLMFAIAVQTPAG